MKIINKKIIEERIKLTSKWYATWPSLHSRLWGWHLPVLGGWTMVFLVVYEKEEFTGGKFSNWPSVSRLLKAPKWNSKQTKYTTRNIEHWNRRWREPQIADKCYPEGVTTVFWCNYGLMCVSCEYLLRSVVLFSSILKFNFICSFFDNPYEPATTFHLKLLFFSLTKYLMKLYYFKTSFRYYNLNSCKVVCLSWITYIFSLFIMKSFSTR